MIIKTVKDFPWGIIDTLEDRSIPPGVASKSLNWLTKIDKIELRRGYLIFGNEIAGSGKITEIFVADMSDGTLIPFRTRGKKLEYYKVSTATWTEIGTNVLGDDADGKEISFAVFHAMAGDQLFINSPYGPFLKIMLANPESYSDMYDSAKNFKCYIKIKQNRMFGFYRLKDRTGVYISYIDSQNYTDVSNENIGTGDGSTKTFNETLDFKAGGAKRTCFGIVVSDTVETFIDNNDGTLTGDQGGTGTINYTSGAISVTFNTAPTNTQAILADYQWEDSINGGVCDFTYSTPRTAGEGDIFRQDDGGPIMNIFSYGDIEYCIHRHKTWVLTLGFDDTTATNVIYREKVGMPNRRAGVATGDGIYYLDDSDEKDPQIRILTIPPLMEKVIPVSISKAIKYQKKLVGIDLSGYTFNKAIMLEWGDHILLACRKEEDENDRLIIYDKIKKTIDPTDYWVSGLAVYEGTLIAGDPFTKNVYTLFSGFDDDDALILGFREEANWNLDWDGLKKVKKLTIEGEIDLEQTIRVWVSIDDGAYVFVGDIEGSGDYVDRGSLQSVAVGTVTIGSKEIGGGGEGVVAYHYKCELDFGQGKFERTKLKFEPLGLGYASVSLYQYRDIRLKSRRISAKYR